MSDDVVGSVIAGKYRVVSVLGQGAMGVVYRAEQLDSEGAPLRQVALKTIAAHASSDPSFSKRFLHEIRIAARLNHPHVVIVHDSGVTAAGVLYFTMELVEGRTLAELIATEAPLSPRRAVELAGQILEALAEAHAPPHSIVHRDVKPANVFVENQHGRERVKVADFGMARTVNAATNRVTDGGELVGTPRYMAPEQWTGIGVGPQADLYAVGLMIQEMLTGKRAFPEAANLQAIMQQHLETDPAPLPDSVAPPLAMEVRRLLAKVPRQRPPDALAAKRALDEALAESEAPALERPLIERRSRPAPSIARAAERPRGPRFPWLAPLVFVAVVAGIVLLLTPGIGKRIRSLRTLDDLRDFVTDFGGPLARYVAAPERSVPEPATSAPAEVDARSTAPAEQAARQVAILRDVPEDVDQLYVELDPGSRVREKDRLDAYRGQRLVARLEVRSVVRASRAGADGESSGAIVVAARGSRLAALAAGDRLVLR